METKKVNLFTVIALIVMCILTVMVSSLNLNSKAVQNGKDGQDLSINQIYNEYKAANPTYAGTLAEFIEKYMSNILSSEEETTKAALAAQSALRSTVDICFSYSIDPQNYYNVSSVLLQTNTGNVQYGYRVTQPTTPFMNVAAGSGVIYKMDTSSNVKTAYIITNFHVVYVEAYSNSPEYKLFYNQSTGESFTARDDNFQVDNLINGRYLLHNMVETAPVETHFLDEYTIYLNGFQTREAAITASYVGGSCENDIAVLKVEYNPADEATANNALIFNDDYYNAAVIQDSDTISEFNQVIAVGNPLLPNTSEINTSQVSTYEEYLNLVEEAYIDSLCLTTTGGRVSQITCEMAFSSLINSAETNTMRLIKVDAAVNPGNSGGGLYNYDGKLIGIVNGKIADESYDNVGFAIPINIASRIADQIIEQCDGTSAKSIYRITQESLGLSLKEIAGENKPTAGTSWKYEYDVIVKDDPSLLTYGFGKFKAGDRIVSVSLEGDDTVYDLVRAHQLDDILIKAKLPANGETTTVSFKVIRNNEEITISLDFAVENFTKII